MLWFCHVVAFDVIVRDDAVVEEAFDGHAVDAIKTMSIVKAGSAGR
ncbi:hypothetical protein [Rhizobium sp. 3T7]